MLSAGVLWLGSMAGLSVPEFLAFKAPSVYWKGKCGSKLSHCQHRTISGTEMRAPYLLF